MVSREEWGFSEQTSLPVEAGVRASDEGGSKLDAFDRILEKENARLKRAVANCCTVDQADPGGRPRETSEPPSSRSMQVR